jgi:hypothetical protein
VALLMLGGAAPDGASAQARAPGLNWIRLPGAESCIPAAGLAERVEQRTGRVLFVAPSEAELTIDGHVAPREGGGYRVLLQLADREGERLGERELLFDSDDCSEIDAAVALIIAVTLYPNTGLIGSGIPLDDDTEQRLDALFGAEPTDPDPESLLEVEAEAAAPEHAQQRDAERPSVGEGDGPRTRSEPIEIGFDAVAMGGLGQLPGMGLAGAGYLHLLLPRFGVLEAGVARWMGAEARPDSRMGMLELDLLSAVVHVCPWQVVLPEARLCAGAEVGLMSARPSGFEVTGDASDDVVASALATLRYRPRIAGPLRMRIALTALLPLVQRAYTSERLDGSTEQLYRASQLAVSGEIGLGASF